MNERRPLRWLVALLLATMFVSACGEDDDGALGSTSQAAEGASMASGDDQSAPEIRTLRVTADDYSFEGMPTEIPAGTVTIELTNTGREPHEVQLVRLDEGMTAEEFLVDVEERGITAAAETISQYGGPSTAVPGDTIASTQVLDPGNYVLLCLIPSFDGTLHVHKGMSQDFVVTEGDSLAALPETSETIVASDFEYQLPKDFTGSGDVRLKVTGKQDHAITVFRLVDGKTLQDVLDFVEGRALPPLPFSRVLGVAAVRPGASATFRADLEPGRYALICFIGDRRTGKPHFALGMAQEIKVR